MKTSTSDKKPHSEKRSLKSCCWYATLVMIGFPILLVCVGVCVMALRDRSAHAKAQKLQTELEASGLAMTLDDLGTAYLEETDQRYVAEWQELLGEIMADQFQADSEAVPLYAEYVQSEFPSPKEPWKYQQPVEEFLEKYDRLYLKVRRLTLKQLDPEAKYVRFPLLFKIYAQLDDWENLLRVADLLALHGQMAVRRSDSAAVRRDVMAILGCSKVASPNINFHSSIINTSIHRMALAVLEKALKEDVLTSADIELLLPLIIDECQLIETWPSIIAGEMQSELLIYDHPEMAKNPGFPMPFRGNDRLLYLESMKGLSEAPLDDLDNFHAVSRANTFDLENVETLWEKFNSYYSSLRVASKMAVTSIELTRVTKSRALVVAMRLRLHEDMNGSMPAALQDVEGIDLSIFKPAGGKPFGYQENEQNVLLWWDYNFGPTPEEPPKIGKYDYLEARSRVQLRLAEPPTDGD